MQQTATDCNRLQQSATYRSCVQPVAPRATKTLFATSSNTLQHTATHCNMLQHAATHCNMLQHTTTNYIILQDTATCCNKLQRTATHCNSLQYTTTHCNTLQHTTTHWNIPHHTATHCNTLQHTATQYNTLQHTATYCNTCIFQCSLGFWSSEQQLRLKGSQIWKEERKLNTYLASKWWIWVDFNHITLCSPQLKSLEQSQLFYDTSARQL